MRVRGRGTMLAVLMVVGAAAVALVRREGREAPRPSSQDPPAVAPTPTAEGATSSKPPESVPTTEVTVDPRPTTATGPPSPAVPPGQPLWRPRPGASWHWQLSGRLDQAVEAETYDIDLFDNDSATVAALHAAGRRVICYMSAGSYEEWRPDASRFPTSVLGAPLDEWPGERWLDIRRIDVLGPLMEQRLDLCRAKGFDGVEPDNVDGYANRTGFALSAADQLAYNRFLADAAHARGLSVGLKNDVEQVADLVDSFDFAVNEECARYDECEELQRFIAAGKAVLHVEYDLPRASFCPQARRLGFSSMLKRRELDAWFERC